MAAPIQSQARRTLRRQVALIWGALLFLWPVFGILLAGPMAGRASLAEPLLIGAGLLALAVLGWRIGIRAVDSLVGPMLDRLALAAKLATRIDPLTGANLPLLVSENPQTSLGQLASHLEEAQDGLRAQVDHLSSLNRALEQAREDLLRAERLAVVGRLSAGLAHEIGNPLGALIGFIGLARSASEGPLRDEALLGIETQAQRIHRTLGELMDFARAGKMDLAPSSLPNAIRVAERLVRAHPRWRQMRLAIELGVEPGAAVPAVLASEHHLVQVLVNLLLNAADACQGTGEVHIDGREGPRTFALVVADDGPGIPIGEEERIFEPFVSSKPVGHGTGLGLAICRQIMESFGGSIRALSNRPGARFELVLRTPAP